MAPSVPSTGRTAPRAGPRRPLTDRRSALCRVARCTPAFPPYPSEGRAVAGRPFVVDSAYRPGVSVLMSGRLVPLRLGLLCCSYAGLHGERRGADLAFVLEVEEEAV